MFGTIRKHQRWLWVVIIAFVIVSFVFFFSPNQSLGRGGGSATRGVVDGRPVSDSELRTQLHLADLSGYLRFGEAYRSGQAARMGFNRKQELAKRLLIETRRRELGIEVSDEAVAQWIRAYLRDPQTGQFNYNAFIQNSLRPAGFTEADFVSFVRQEVALQQLERLMSVPGRLVTPQEAEDEFRRVNERFDVTVASFPSSNFLASVVVDDAALGMFFTNRLAEYRIPERATLTYVRFATTNHLVEAEEFIAGRPEVAGQVEQLYQQRGADAFRDDANNVLGKEAALEKIRENFVRQVAGQIALSNAVVFANELGQMEPVAASNLAVLAAAKELSVETTPPFPEGGRPFGLEDIRDLASAMGRIGPDQPFTPPMEGARGVVVAALTERIPSTIPPLESIRLRVESDFREVQSAVAARTAGQEFFVAASGALADGKSLEDAASGQPIRLAEVSFTLSSPAIPGLESSLNPALVKQVASTNAVGSLSSFIPTERGGFLLRVRERRAVEDELTRAALNGFLAEQRQAREEDAFRVWFADQMKQSGIATLVENLPL
ncbi:MAG: SurA N-terminal domain-containing protein [Verrucomicrobiae bacterium]|nr:SurA N-terminal domain-containing protein [Verrucomicrobiae bacterium]